jgi:hypothetical protein
MACSCPSGSKSTSKPSARKSNARHTTPIPAAVLGPDLVVFRRIGRVWASGLLGHKILETPSEAIAVHGSCPIPVANPEKHILPRIEGSILWNSLGREFT